MRLLARVGFAAALLAAIACDALAQNAPVDLEIVFAVDASGSVDQREYRLQMAGIAAAFRDKAVYEAIAGGPKGRIAVSVLVWAEASRPKQEGPWFLVATPADAELFARHVEAIERRISGGTGIGAGLAWALRMLDANGIASARRVVDVSGDGPETPPRETVVLIDQARAMALSRGITVNGLAILADDPDLAAWYAGHVVAGPDSFVMAAANFDDYARAFRRKLLREIKPEQRVSTAEPYPLRTDCRQFASCQGSLPPSRASASAMPNSDAFSTPSSSSHGTGIATGQPSRARVE